MPGPAIRSQYGPYYESAISKSQPQRTALGQPALSAPQLAGITQGELEARYSSDFARKQHADDIRLKEEEIKRQEDQEKAKGMGAMGGAVGTVIGGILGTLVFPGVGTVGGAAIGGAVGSMAGGAASK